MDTTNLQPGFTVLGASAGGTAGPLTATAANPDTALGAVKLTLVAGNNIAAATETDSLSGDFISAAAIIARDRGFPSADTAPFTNSRIYRDFLTANAFGIQFSGLYPYTPYQVAFYSYDHSGSRTQIFTNITAGGSNPSASLSYTGGTAFNASTPNTIYATSLTATSDEQGRLFFSGTGTGLAFGTGISSSVQTLSAVEISHVGGTPDAGTVPLFQHHYDGNFTDSSGRSNTGTPAAGAAISTAPADIAKGSAALLLNGTATGSVTLANPLTFTTNQAWTASWWARRDSTGGDKGMVMGDASNANDFIWLSATGLRFRNTGNTSTQDFSFTQDLRLHHYALVATGTNSLLLYRDGVLLGTKTSNTSFVINTIGNAYSSAGYAFSGALDEVQVFGAPLTAAQVSYIYKREKPAPIVVDPPPVVTRVRVILQGGQSNADGRAVVTDLPTTPFNYQQPQTDVDLVYRSGSSAVMTTLRPGVGGNTQFGPEIALGRKMADLWSGETGTRVIILKYAAGGTNLAVQWKAGGDATTTGDGVQYTTFQDTVTKGLALISATYPNAIIDVQGMVWFQGESDAVATIDATTNRTWALSYQQNLTAFISDLRATYGATLPLIIGKLSSKQTNLNATYLEQVRAAQEAVALADPLVGIILTDDFELKEDNLHFNAVGQLAIGEAFASELSYYEWMLENFTTAEIQANLAEQTADYDGDGQSNFKEFLAMTHPKQGSSVFAATFFYLNANSGRIDYATSASRNYTVERYVENSNTWETVLPSLRGTGAIAARPLVLNAPRGIYRVRAATP